MSNNQRPHLDPVSWLFGRDLIASLKTTVLYTVFGAKIDARAWMNAEEYTDFADNANKFVSVDPKTGVREFWFDYMSDTGDGTRATYSIAYLALSNLYVKHHFVNRPSREEDTKVTLEHKTDESDGNNLALLPRGQFLFVGGDTAYHMADYPALSNRFQGPFKWAYEDLENDLAKADLKFDKTERRLFGIPGNHDYYDLLDGFQRQFRRPVRDELKTYQPDEPMSPQLMIPGFVREQQASYAALKLPFGWQLWGLDTDVGKIDERQQEFFKSLIGKGQTADRLIVATSAPTTVFGQYAKKDDGKASKAFYALGLPRLFLPKDRLEPGEVAPELRSDQIRLDISGDLHHYARYWGNVAPRPDPVKDPTPREGRSKKTAASSDNYASVVSGLGGAFHHPSMTYKDEVREQVLYPTEDISRHAVARKIFNPWHVSRGGWVHGIGFVMVFIIYFSATHVQSSRQAVSTFPLWNWIAISAQEPITPTVPDALPPPRQATGAASTPAPQAKSRYFHGLNAKPIERGYKWSAILLCLSLGLAIIAVATMEYLYKKFTGIEETLAGELNSLKTGGRGNNGEDFKGEAQAAQDEGSGGAVVAVREETQKTAKDTKITEALRRNDALVRVTKVCLYALTAALLGVALFGVTLMLPYRANITPFGNSLLVLLSLVWAACAVLLSMRYSDWLFQQTAKRQVKETEWWVTGLLYICAVLSVGTGIWVFGKNNLPAFLLSDIIFVVTILGAVSLMGGVLPLGVGGTYNSGLGKARLVVFGLWHALLQIFVAFLLVRKGTWLTLLLAAAVVFVFTMAGTRMMRRRKSGPWLAGVWLFYGALMLLLPWLVFSFLTSRFVDRSSWLFRAAFWPTEGGARWLESFRAYEWWAPYNAMVEPVNGWWGLVPALLAGVVGAAMCCAWFGWYLGVSSLFNSHYNEAGGAAKIEKFKQFVRIRLTPDTLTGYVIAVDCPEEKGNKLDPKLIDVFHLKAVQPVKP